MSMEERVLDKLVELARNPTRDDMAAMDRMLNEARAKCDRVQRERDKAFAEKNVADPLVTELWKAAQEIAHARVVGKQDNSPQMVRLRKALKEAASHIDLIPF